MGCLLAPVLVASALLLALRSKRLWSAPTVASRGHAVLCGGALGAVGGWLGVEASCWFDRACRTGLGDGMAQGMVLLVFSVLAAIGAGGVGLLLGWLLGARQGARRVLFIAAPALCLAAPFAASAPALWPG